MMAGMHLFTTCANGLLSATLYGTVSPSAWFPPAPPQQDRSFFAVIVIVPVFEPFQVLASGRRVTG